MTGATSPQRFLLIADWGLSQNSSVTLQHILQSAANTTSAPAVLYIADFCYAGELTLLDHLAAAVCVCNAVQTEQHVSQRALCVADNSRALCMLHVANSGL